jgi:UDP-glucose 4-epimerase
MKYLVTGIAGLLGANFSRYLLDKGHKVIGIDDLSGGYKEFVPTSSVFYHVDVTHAGAINQIFSKERPDVVFHFAANAAEG